MKTEFLLEDARTLLEAFIFYPVFLRISFSFYLHLSTIDMQEMFCNLHPILIDICQDYMLAQLLGKKGLFLCQKIEY